MWRGAFSLSILVPFSFTSAPRLPSPLQIRISKAFQVVVKLRRRPSCDDVSEIYGVGHGCDAHDERGML